MDKDCDEDEILANFLESEILSADFSTATSTAFEQKHVSLYEFHLCA